MTRRRTTARWGPAWMRHYTRAQAAGDSSAALVVSLTLAPQALAYAMLAGLPPYVGLYASMLPLLVYGLLGTSSTLSIGPVTITSLMTASAIVPFALSGTAGAVAAASLLALISGGILLAAGGLKLGFLVRALSHSAISGFIGAASLMIALSQLPAMLGITASGSNLPQLLDAIRTQAGTIHLPTLCLSLLVGAILLGSRRFMASGFTALGMPGLQAQTLARMTPVLLVVAGVLAVQSGLSWLEGVRTVGAIPSGLPPVALPEAAPGAWQALWLPGALIAIVGYIGSVSVAQNLAARRHERIEPDRELVAMGAANVASGLTSGLPVSAGLARSVVNADQGAATPAAGILTAGGMVLIALLAADWLDTLPRAILAATIAVAAVSQLDFDVLRRTWRLGVRDRLAWIATFALTLMNSVEWGIGTGILLSAAMRFHDRGAPRAPEE